MLGSPTKKSSPGSVISLGSVSSVGRTGRGIFHEPVWLSDSSVSDEDGGIDQAKLRRLIASLKQELRFAEGQEQKTILRAKLEREQALLYSKFEVPNRSSRKRTNSNPLPGSTGAMLPPTIPPTESTEEKLKTYKRRLSEAKEANDILQRDVETKEETQHLLESRVTELLSETQALQNRVVLSETQVTEKQAEVQHLQDLLITSGGPETLLPLYTVLNAVLRSLDVEEAPAVKGTQSDICIDIENKLRIVETSVKAVASTREELHASRVKIQDMEQALKAGREVIGNEQKLKEALRDSELIRAQAVETATRLQNEIADSRSTLQTAKKNERNLAQQLETIRKELISTQEAVSETEQELLASRRSHDKESTALRDTVTEQRGTIKSLSEGNTEITLQLSSLRANLESAASEKAQITSNAVRHQDMLATVSKENASLKAELNTQEAVLRETTTEGKLQYTILAQEYEAKLQSLIHEKDEKQRKALVLEDENETLTKQLSEAQLQLTTLTARNTALEEETEKRKVHLDELTTQSADLDQERTKNNALQRQLAEAQLQLAALGTKNAVLEEESEKLQAHLTELDEEQIKCEGLQRQLAEAQLQLAALGTKNAVLEEESKKLQAHLTELDEEQIKCDGLQRQLAEAQLQLATKNAALEEESEKMQVHLTELDEEQVKCDGLQRQLADLRQCMSQETVSGSAKLHALEHENRSFTNDIEKERSQNKLLKTQLAEVQKHLSRETAAGNAKLVAFENLTEEHEQERSKVLVLQTQLQQLQQQMSQNAEAESVKLHNMKNSIAVLEQKNAALEGDLEREQSKTAELRLQTSSNTTKLLAVNSDLIALKKQHDSLTEEHDKERSRHEEKQQAYCALQQQLSQETIASGAKLVALTGELEREQLKTAGLQTQLLEMRQQTAHTTSESVKLTTLEKQHATMAEVNHTLQGQVTDLRRRAGDTERELSETRMKLETETRQAELLSSELARIEDAKETLQKQISGKEEEVRIAQEEAICKVNAARRQVSEIEEVCNNLQSKLTDTGSTTAMEMQAALSDLAREKERSKELEHQQKESQTRLQEVQEQAMQRVKTAREEVEARIAAQLAVEDEIAELKEENTVLKSNAVERKAKKKGDETTAPNVTLEQHKYLWDLQGRLVKEQQESLKWKKAAQESENRLRTSSMERPPRPRTAVSPQPVQKEVTDSFGTPPVSRKSVPRKQDVSEVSNSPQAALSIQRRGSSETFSSPPTNRDVPWKPFKESGVSPQPASRKGSASDLHNLSTSARRIKEDIAKIREQVADSCNVAKSRSSSAERMSSTAKKYISKPRSAPTHVPESVPARKRVPKPWERLASSRGSETSCASRFK